MNRDRREKYTQELTEWEARHKQEAERRARLGRKVDASLQSIKALNANIGMIQRDAGLIGVACIEAPDTESRIAKNTEGMTDDQRRHFIESMDFVNAQVGLIGLAEKLIQIAENLPKFENAPAKLFPAWIEDRLLEELSDMEHIDRQRIIDEIFNAAGVNRVTENTLRSHRKSWRLAKKR